MRTIGAFFKNDKSLRVWFAGDFDNPVNGQATIKDLSGNGFHGTPQNSDPADPNIAKISSSWRSKLGLRILGSSSSNGPYFTFPVWQSGTTDYFTMMAWFIWKGPAIDDGYNSGAIQSVISTAVQDSSTYLAIWITEFNDDLSVRTGNWRFLLTGRVGSSANLRFFSKTYLYPDRPYFVAGVKSGTTRELYVNGNLENKITNDYTGYSILSPICGAMENNISPWRYHFRGYILEVGCFNRPLSSQEILEYYRWVTSSPKKYWYFASPPPPQIPSTRRLIIAST